MECSRWPSALQEVDGGVGHSWNMDTGLDNSVRCPEYDHPAVVT